MTTWPISTREAARRIGIPQSTANTLVKGLRIPTIPVGGANGLDEASFAQLQEAARPFRARPRRPAAVG